MGSSCWYRIWLNTTFQTVPTYHNITWWTAVSLPLLRCGLAHLAVWYSSVPSGTWGRTHVADLCLHKTVSVLGAETQWHDSSSSWKELCLSRRQPQLLWCEMLPCLESAGARTVQHAGKQDRVVVDCAPGCACRRDKGGSWSEHMPSAQASPVLTREFPHSTVSASHLFLYSSSRYMVGTCLLPWSPGGW